MAYYSSSSSCATPQPFYPSDSDASAVAASSRAPVAWQSTHILASDPSIHFYLGASHHGAPDDNPSLALTMYEDPWKIKKELTMCDVNGCCRLLLSRDVVEEHVLSSMDKDNARLCRTGTGKEFEVWDSDESVGHRLFLKKWDNNEYFVLTGNWKRNFVNRRGLKIGDTIGLAWDGVQFYFKLLKRN